METIPCRYKRVVVLWLSTVIQRSVGGHYFIDQTVNTEKNILLPWNVPCLNLVRKSLRFKNIHQISRPYWKLGLRVSQMKGKSEQASQTKPVNTAGTTGVFKKFCCHASAAALILPSWHVHVHTHTDVPFHICTHMHLHTPWLNPLSFVK